MADDPEPSSKRADARKAAQDRRVAKAALSESAFNALTSGWSVQQIADARKLSVRTVQREIDRAIAERRLDAPDRFVHLQVARLTKALRVADNRLDRGELAAIAPLLRVVAALDRYHRPNDRTDPVRSAPADMDLPAPALALTHAASQSDPVDATNFGA